LRVDASRLDVALKSRRTPAIRKVPLATARARRALRGHNHRTFKNQPVAGDG
jgi:hypothetical protein